MELSKVKDSVKTDFLTLGVLNPSAKNLPSSATVELVLKSRKTTLQDKLSTCESNSQMQKLLKTSGAGLILKEKGLIKSWTNAYQGLQSHLLWPIETGCADLGLSLLSTLSTRMVEKSWFSTTLNQVQKKNSLKTFLPYFMSSRAECTGSEDTVVKSKRIRIYPNTEQKKTLRQWMGVARLAYNESIDILNKKEYQGGWMGIWPVIREKERLNKDYVESTPFQIKKLATQEAHIAYRNAIKKYKKGQGFSKLSFRSKRNPCQTINIISSAIKSRGIYVRYLGDIKYSEELPEIIKDSSLSLYRGKWYLNVTTEIKAKRAENKGRFVAIDPGVRSFISFFSEDCFGQIGKHDFGRISRLCFYLDDLISKMSKTNAKKRRQMKKAANRIRDKITNLVDELHWKSARFLVDNFDVIFLPKFETSRMAKKSSRKIKSKSVRMMLSLSHYKFSQRLSDKCFESGKTLIQVSEAYTSMFNGLTGELMDIKSKEFFDFNGIKINRDLNGARNILCFSLLDSTYVRNNIANVNVS